MGLFIPTLISIKLLQCNSMTLKLHYEGSKDRPCLIGKRSYGCANYSVTHEFLPPLVTMEHLSLNVVFF